jgi:hypothetical protein
MGEWFGQRWYFAVLSVNSDLIRLGDLTNNAPDNVPAFRQKFILSCACTWPSNRQKHTNDRMCFMLYIIRFKLMAK